MVYDYHASTMGDIWEGAPSHVRADLEQVLVVRCVCDGKVRRFLNEARADAWVERHRACGGA